MTRNNPTLEQYDQKAAYDEFMQDVDYFIERRIGATSADLPDCPYWDWFDDGVSPKSAARRAIRYANDEEM